MTYPEYSYKMRIVIGIPLFLSHSPNHFLSRSLSPLGSPLSLRIPLHSSAVAGFPPPPPPPRGCDRAEQHRAPVGGRSERCGGVALVGGAGGIAQAAVAGGAGGMACVV